MLANAAARVIHELPVQDIGSLADRCRDHLGCERRILIVHMAVSLEARDVSLFRVDQIHRLAFIACYADTTVAGCRMHLSSEIGSTSSRACVTRFWSFAHVSVSLHNKYHP